MTTTWTASRADLIRELQRARGERNAAMARLHAATSELNARKTTTAGRYAETEERRRQHNEREAIRWSAEAQHLLNTGAIPPDPLAPAHRKTLSDALKGKTP